MFFLFSNWFRVILGCPYIHNELKPNQALPSYHKQSWSTTVPKFLLKLIFLCLHPTQRIATANTATPFPMTAHGSQSVTLTTAIQEMQEGKRFASRCTDVIIQFLILSNCILFGTADCLMFIPSLEICSMPVREMPLALLKHRTFYSNVHAI